MVGSVLNIPGKSALYRWDINEIMFFYRTNHRKQQLNKQTKEEAEKKLYI